MKWSAVSGSAGAASLAENGFVHTFESTSGSRPPGRVMHCAFDATDRLSSMCPPMGIKPGSEAAAVAWPDAEVIGELGPRTCGELVCVQ